MINETFAVSIKVKPRTIPEVFLQLSEEVGELATEVSILQGFKNRAPGVDGILGEGVDVMVCVLDIIKLAYGNSVSAEDILAKTIEKLQKWEFNDSVRPLQ